jgi:hypothetical protein
MWARVQRGPENEKAARKTGRLCVRQGNLKEVCSIGLTWVMNPLCTTEMTLPNRVQAAFFRVLTAFSTSST